MFPLYDTSKFSFLWNQPIVPRPCPYYPEPRPFQEWRPGMYPCAPRPSSR
jgi:hypothetical protein